MSLTYLEFLALALAPPIALLAGAALVGGCRLGRSHCVGAGLGLVTLVGLLYTTPWDNDLVARGVWWYGEGAVLARIWHAPVEEYLFMLVQPVLTGLWLTRFRLPPVSVATTAMTLTDRLAGALAGGVVSAVGLGFLLVDATFYLGAILAWAGPVLALQWAFGWRYLWAQRRVVSLGILVPTTYLAAADRVAIELGIWVLSPLHTTGLTVAGLPIEEGLFFLVTNVFVVQGLVLFVWVVDR